jgi:hypothetical protein
MAKKFNKSLLNEELKKFKLLSEYSFYTEDKSENDDLILGTSLEEAEGDEEATDAPATDAPADDAPVDDSKTAANQQDAGGDEATTDQATTEDQDAMGDMGDETTPEDQDAMGDMGDETTPEDQDAMGDMGDETAPAGDEAAPEDMSGGEEDVEVDVTSLVQGSEEAKDAATSASQKTDELLAKFNDLEARISKMDAISTKINDLEQEIVKRNPTPVEKLEMRSLDSFPYNIKLTDYFKDIQGYDVGSEEKQPQEYVLTKDDVDSDFLDQSVKDSFNIPDDYEEEDVY